MNSEHYWDMQEWPTDHDHIVKTEKAKRNVEMYIHDRNYKFLVYKSRGKLLWPYNFCLISTTLCHKFVFSIFFLFFFFSFFNLQPLRAPGRREIDWAGRQAARQTNPASTLMSIFFSCDQAALRTLQSVCLSIRLSVCPSVRPSVTPFSLCSHHRIIRKFSGFITNDKSDVHAKVQGQRSKVTITEVKTQLSRFRTVTPVWIHIWWWNDAQNLMLLRRGALLFFKVIRQIPRSHG